MKRVLDGMSGLVHALSRPPAFRPTPLREVIDEVLQRYDLQIQESGARVRVTEARLQVTTDPQSLRDALGALLANALFFNDRPQGDRAVSIDCATSEDEARICVSDNGIGIDPRWVGQVFELGLKLDKSRGGGPGYGLYLARRLAESLGGSISVESTPGEGSTFCIRIPGPAGNVS